MPDPNLFLDRVTHVSLVDEPEVGDSQWMVMKRDGEDDPEGIQEALEAVKAGRELSRGNLKTLASIYDSISGQHPAAAEELETFLRGKASEDELEEILETDSIMGDNDISELVEQVEKNNEAVTEAAEAASEAAEAAAQAAEAATATEGEAGEGSEGEGGEGQEGGQEAGGSGGSDALSDAAQERIQELEGLAVEAGLIEEDEVTEFGQEDGQEDGAELDEATEKRLSTIEKALNDKGGRAGSASALDGQADGPDDYVSKGRSGSSQVKDIMGAVQQEGE